MPERSMRFAQVYDFFQARRGQQGLRYGGGKMGLNLQELFNSFREDVEDGLKDYPFTKKEIFMVADQALDCINAIHDCGFVHRDIKPDNFCVRDTNSNELCSIDFGLSKRFMTGEGATSPCVATKAFFGTPRYASLRCHQGYQLSRRDDLESFLAHGAVFFRAKASLARYRTRK